VSGLLVVVGLRREARIIDGRARVAIGTAALEMALDGAERVLSFGLCGGLDPALAVGDLVIGEGVTGPEGRIAGDREWTEHLAAALPGAARCDIAGSAVMVGGAAEKAALRRATGAGAVDMESRQVALAAQARGLPFAILRAVSDPAGRTLPRAALAGFRADGEPDVLAVLAALAARPRDLPPLLRTARDAGRGYRALKGAFAAALGRP
jgi:hypothetical protein